MAKSVEWDPAVLSDGSFGHRLAVSVARLTAPLLQSGAGMSDRIARGWAFPVARAKHLLAFIGLLREIALTGDSAQRRRGLHRQDLGAQRLRADGMTVTPFRGRGHPCFTSGRGHPARDPPWHHRTRGPALESVLGAAVFGRESDPATRPSHTPEATRRRRERPRPRKPLGR